MIQDVLPLLDRLFVCCGLQQSDWKHFNFKIFWRVLILQNQIRAVRKHHFSFELKLLMIVLKCCTLGTHDILWMQKWCAAIEYKMSVACFSIGFLDCQLNTHQIIGSVYKSKMHNLLNVVVICSAIDSSASECSWHS